ncbi:unnamed protein product [Brachionus calyciflorus]|uniref:DDE-1 domain-containing protein n=1 Tax=Brachionus calyciflorus TaxID=104777 RepID=A0A814RM22_9BILA|nr:unnamed protein product [Brachionus calyciflorus]
MKPNDVKVSKETISLLFTCNMSVREKLKPLVVSHSENPRCFKSINKANLPVYYRHNRKAWMDSCIFKEWLIKWNKQLKAENRKVLLFLDNFSGHKNDPSCENIKTVYFPVNSKSVLQPLDQGIIHSFKVKNRKDVAREILYAIEQGSDIPTIDILSSIYKIKRVCDGVSPSTIRNCFRKAGYNREFLFNTLENEEEDQYREIATFEKN